MKIELDWADSQMLVVSSVASTYALAPGLCKALFPWRISCPRKEDHPSSRVNFSKHLYEKKLTTLSEPSADNSARACSDCFALTDLTRLGESKCFNM